MSVYSGIAAAGVAIALAAVAAGLPLWEWRLESPQETEVWSYSPFRAQHMIYNKTTGTTTVNLYYTYEQLAPLQGNMSRVLTEFGQFFVLGVVAAFAGIALSVGTIWKKIRGIFAGIAFLGACGSTLYAAFAIVFMLPPAATADLPSFGVGFREFRGQIGTPGSGPVLSWSPLLGWVLVIGAGLAFAWASSDAWHVRPLKKLAASMPSQVTVRPIRIVAAGPAPPPPAEMVQKVPPEPLIEEVFVIGSSGLLIKHMSRSLMSDKDRDVVGSMISAISSFVREAFTERDGEVHEVTLGDHRFVMCNERGLVVAVLVKSGDTEDIVHRLRHLLVVLKDRYGDRLEQWQGEPLEGIEDELGVLWEPYHLPPPPAA